MSLGRALSLLRSHFSAEHDQAWDREGFMQSRRPCSPGTQMSLHRRVGSMIHVDRCVIHHLVCLGSETLVGGYDVVAAAHARCLAS